MKCIIVCVGAMLFAFGLEEATIAQPAGGWDMDILPSPPANWGVMPSDCAEAGADIHVCATTATMQLENCTGVCSAGRPPICAVLNGTPAAAWNAAFQPGPDFGLMKPALVTPGVDADGNRRPGNQILIRDKYCSQGKQCQCKCSFTHQGLSCAPVKGSSRLLQVGLVGKLGDPCVVPGGDGDQSDDTRSGYTQSDRSSSDEGRSEDGSGRNTGESTAPQHSQSSEDDEGRY